MIINEQKTRVATKALEYFQNGYHCAESIVASVLEQIGEDYQEAIAHATAFGGGFGRSCEETCGALSGAMIVIGHLHGRREPGVNWDLPANLGARIREELLKQQGTAHCRTLRDNFGEECQLEECQKLTADLAATLFELITTKQDDQLTDNRCYFTFMVVIIPDSACA